MLTYSPSWSCTIFCAKDSKGHIWTGNNEDYDYFTFDTQIKITPKTDSTLGYFHFRYNDNLMPQGGVNESGLFFDFNSLKDYPIRKGANKIAFPGKIYPQ